MIVNRPAEAWRGQGPVDAKQLTREQRCLSPWLMPRLGGATGVDQFVTVHAGKSRQPTVDGLKQHVSHGGGGLTVWFARLLEAKLGEGVVEFGGSSGGWRRLAEPPCKHGVFDAGERAVPINGRTFGGGSHKKSLHGSLRTRILEGLATYCCPCEPHRRATVAGLELVGGAVRPSQDARREVTRQQFLSTSV